MYLHITKRIQNLCIRKVKKNLPEETYSSPIPLQFLPPTHPTPHTHAHTVVMNTFLHTYIIH